MKKILLAVTGMSPAIVTETLYALATRETPWIPDEVHLLSTSKGCNNARLQLLHKDQAVFQKFCEEYIPESHSIRFDESCLHTFTRDGVELDDIHNLEDSSFVADEIARFVFEMTQEKNSEIHASIAGGRKTMGFLLGYSMSLYGRSQDRLSHVLVSEGYETNPNFYYPTKTSKVIYDKQNKPLDTSLAKVMLAEIPILHLRNRLPKAMKEKPANFSDLVAVLNSNLEEPKIEIDVAYDEEKRADVATIKCHGVEVKMTPVNAGFYLFLSRKARDGKDVDLEDLSADEFLAIKDFGQDYIKREETRDENLKQFTNDKSLKKFFDDRRNEIKNTLLEKLGLIGEEKYLIQAKRNTSLFYVDVKDIQINEA